jgi:hypothetical protein
VVTQASTQVSGLLVPMATQFVKWWRTKFSLSSSHNHNSGCAGYRTMSGKHNIRSYCLNIHQLGRWVYSIRRRGKGPSVNLKSHLTQTFMTFELKFPK